MGVIDSRPRKFSPRVLFSLNVRGRTSTVDSCVVARTHYYALRPSAVVNCRSERSAPRWMILNQTSRRSAGYRAPARSRPIPKAPASFTGCSGRSAASTIRRWMWRWMPPTPAQAGRRFSCAGPVLSAREPAALCFLGEGIPDIAAALAKRNVGFVLRRFPDHSLLRFCDEVKAALVVGDENPMREPESWRRTRGQETESPAVDGRR